MYIVRADFTAYSASTDALISSVAEFNELAERASDIIDMLTFNRITDAGGVSALPTATQTAVKKATCAEVQAIYDAGGIAALNGGMSGNFSIGKYSISNGNGGAGGVPISPFVSQYLYSTGLVYRGVKVL